MHKTKLTLEVTTHLPLTDDQRRHLINAIAQQVKELEYGDIPRGNTPQTIFVLEQSE